MQRIASQVPSYSQDEIILEGESTETKNLHNPTIPRSHVRDQVEPTMYTGHQRSKSFTLDVKVSVDATASNPREITYPFTDVEREQLVLNFLDTLNYNSILDSEHIASVNDLFDDQVLAFKTDCGLNIEYLHDLMGESQAILDNLTSLTIQYDKVTKDTLDFATQSSALLKKQGDLEEKAQEMERVLQMFEPLERVTKTLISSGNKIIKTGKLSSILHQLQECLDFLAQHEDYKDYEFYMIRYRQCMTRGLTLVRNYLIETLKAKQSSVAVQLQEKDLTTLKLDILMYSEFTSDLDKPDANAKFPVLVTAIVGKCVSHTEYQGLVMDVLHQYFRLRLQLVQFYVRQQQESSLSLDQVGTMQFCQKSISMFKKLLEREYTLFHSYFPVHAFDGLQQGWVYDELYNFFKQALEPLYDEVRNRVLREVSITELCHLTNMLTSYFDFDEELSVVSLHAGRIEYGELFEPMLNDAQARLIFRIQNYIDNKLLKYKPNPEDLQLGNRKKLNDTQASRQNSAFDSFEDNLFPELYVPVGIALSILSNVYELVSSIVFDDLAHYIIHSCIFMLKGGAVKLAIAHLGPVDAKLFYLKNLVMLKNQLNNFDIQFVRTETSLDFTSGIQELIQILRNGQLYVKFNETGGLLELVKKSAPKVINDMIDAKYEIELELSNCVNEFVTECTNQICAPILGDDSLSLKEKAVQVNDNVLMKIPHFHTQIEQFIKEDEITRYLLDMLANLTSSTYEAYYKTLEEKIAQKTVSAEEMDEIMEPDTFYNFLSETIAALNNDQSSDVSEPIQFNEDILRSLDTPEPEVILEKHGGALPNAEDHDPLEEEQVQANAESPLESPLESPVSPAVLGSVSPLGEAPATLSPRGQTVSPNP